jgi:hypothetical protein
MVNAKRSVPTLIRAPFLCIVLGELGEVTNAAIHVGILNESATKVVRDGWMLSKFYGVPNNQVDTKALGARAKNRDGLGRYTVVD